MKEYEWQNVAGRREMRYMPIKTIPMVALIAKFQKKPVSIFVVGNRQQTLRGGTNQ